MNIGDNSQTVKLGTPGSGHAPLANLEPLRLALHSLLPTGAHEG